MVTPAMTVAGEVVMLAACEEVGHGLGLGVGEGGVGFEVGVGVEPGVEVGRGVGPPVREGVPVGVVPGGGDVATGFAPGEVFATGVGEASATPDTTCSGAWAWQAFFQQIFTM